MKQAGNINNILNQPNNQGFTLWELLVVIAGIGAISLYLMTILSSMRSVREMALRIDCLSNQNGLWRAASRWGMDPPGTWRSSFPHAYLSSALAADYAAVTPEMFICPGAIGKNKSWGIAPATNLASVRATNSNYAYYSDRRTGDGALVLIADKNGSNNLPSPTAWGGNHDGKGGNVIRVGGQGFWVSTPSGSIDAQYYITNADIVAAFTNTGPVFAY